MVSTPMKGGLLMNLIMYFYKENLKSMLYQSVANPALVNWLILFPDYNVGVKATVSSCLIFWIILPAPDIVVSGMDTHIRCLPADTLE